MKLVKEKFQLAAKFYNNTVFLDKEWVQSELQHGVLASAWGTLEFREDIKMHKTFPRQVTIATMQAWDLHGSRWGGGQF